MSTESLQRPVLLGVLGCLAIMTLGVTIGMAMQMSDAENTGPTGLNSRIGLISGECARELESIEREIEETQAELTAWRQEVANLQAERLSGHGEPIMAPDDIPLNQTETGFREVMQGLAAKTIKLSHLDCSSYPCLAVFEDEKPGLTDRLRSGSRKGGFSWSERWVSESKSQSDWGDRYFTALRFYPGKSSLTTEQRRYLIAGLEEALDKVMNSEPNDK